MMPGHVLCKALARGCNGPCSQLGILQPFTLARNGCEVFPFRTDDSHSHSLSRAVKDHGSVRKRENQASILLELEVGPGDKPGVPLLCAWFLWAVLWRKKTANDVCLFISTYSYLCKRERDDIKYHQRATVALLSQGHPYSCCLLLYATADLGAGPSLTCVSEVAYLK